MKTLLNSTQLRGGHIGYLVCAGERRMVFDEGAGFAAGEHIGELELGFVAQLEGVVDGEQPGKQEVGVEGEKQQC